MFKFSRRSKHNISTIARPLEALCFEAIKVIDFSVISGHRSPCEQMLLYSKGRRLENGVWTIVDKKRIVTHLDGCRKRSKHNEFPSLAMDIQPYPFDGTTKSFKELAKVIKKIWDEMEPEDKEGFKLVWGGDWKMRDYYHWELRPI